MILSAAAISGNNKQKIVRKNESVSEESSSELSEYKDDDEGDVSDVSEVSDDCGHTPVHLLKETWNFLKPPTPEDNILRKCFGVNYRTKKKQHPS